MIRTNLSCVLFDGFRVCVIRAVTVREGGRSIVQRGGAARCPVLLRPATTVDPRRFSMYNNDLINLATDPEGPGHNNVASL